MIPQTKAIAQTLQSILSPAAVCEWGNIEIDRQKHLSKAVSEDTTPSCIVYPNTQEELAQIIACAHQQRWRVLPCGNGSKLSWGGLAKGIDVIISTERLNRAIEHAVGDLTITVEAGAKFADIQPILAKAAQFIALDPAYPQTATIGGIVATADAGSLRQRYGGVRDMLLGISFVRYDGQIAKAGGRVVKNVAGYDLMKLFTGSFGTLGIISQVTFRLYPLPEASQTVVLTGTADAIAQATKTLLASALTPTAVDLLSTQLVANLGLGKGMGLVSRFQSVTESVREQSNRLLEVGEKLSLQCSSYAGNDEANLWQQLQQSMQASGIESAIACKIGVLPTAAVATLSQLDKIASGQGMGLIHAGSGLGVLRFESENAIDGVKKMRSHCQSHSGFLTVLEAPISFKQKLDIWGYSGNALDLMRRIKQQFDPENIFSPHRFVGGI
ncbi:FAD-binding oxidoreductase [Aerosakkonema funiforme]|uniref:FAD-binding oxidoreductase n=1 Tax=Planktothrix sp. FACHB-1355 TaxID=2692854 RepID=UPI002AC8293F|nr:FAD-binding oxidoreductase [Aerosakkonema funiforme]